MLIPKENIEYAFEQISDDYSNIGYNKQSYKSQTKAVISELFLANPVPFLKNLTIDILKSLKKNKNLPSYMRKELVSISFVLSNMGIIKESLSFPSQKGRRFGVEDAITTGAATNGEPWKYYDLGHGLCTYDFFSQCKHPMACAGCGFYIPKGSSKAQIIEAKGNLERMLQEIPLTEDEQLAVEEGIEALTKLKAKLADVPTPSGQTPRQLEEERKNA